MNSCTHCICSMADLERWLNAASHLNVHSTWLRATAKSEASSSCESWINFTFLSWLQRALLPLMSFVRVWKRMCFVYSIFTFIFHPVSYTKYYVRSIRSEHCMGYTLYNRDMALNISECCKWGKLTHKKYVRIVYCIQH